jgi:hypothetical protein
MVLKLTPRGISRSYNNKHCDNSVYLDHDLDVSDDTEELPKSHTIALTRTLISTLPDELVQAIREEFKRLDVNNDGYITRLDIYAHYVQLYTTEGCLFQQMNMTLEELVEHQTEHLMSEIDDNKNQKISWEQWLAYKGKKVIMFNSSA